MEKGSWAALKLGVTLSQSEEEENMALLQEVSSHPDFCSINCALNFMRIQLTEEGG